MGQFIPTQTACLQLDLPRNQGLGWLKPSRSATDSDQFPKAQRYRQALSLEGTMDLFYTSPIEPYSLVWSCINCAMPANLLATFTLILMGVSLATYVERRKSILLRTGRRHP